ncbi:hypothetical protein SAMN04487771_10263 [[Clostridium] aminophilum]|uniref:Acetyltransferase (GNAT) domain-containing protein n=1 Tax=[Clostridium] aminophilum TaxID=1526 RepID=A0A1I0FKV6_9FIRM|nr:hypothetical protein [[Clostridium] aminophilum]SET57886.1 hypothetical protein SAMN04487771_10263 [[Clostridium] aminophilum]
MDDTWIIEKVSPEEYSRCLPENTAFFNSVRFCELNKGKVDEVLYLIIKKGNSNRFGMIIGVKDSAGKCPFSAPYSFPVALNSNNGVSDYDSAIQAIDNFCRGEGIKNLRFTLPPLTYDEHHLAAWVSSFYRHGYRMVNMDINYILDLKKLNVDNYEQIITKKSRSHLRKAIKSGMSVCNCLTEDELREAYNIIKINHDSKGRPTWMTFEQIYETMKLTEYAAFIAILNGENIASMIYYSIDNRVAQCIYSGLIPGYENSGAMNFLSWHAIRYFGNKGYSIIDRAIATEDSIPNYGLCDFKESIGGERSLKFTFDKSFEKQGVSNERHYLSRRSRNKVISANNGHK